MTAPNAVADGISNAQYGDYHKRLDDLNRRVKIGHPRGVNWILDELQRIIEGKPAFIPHTLIVESDGELYDTLWDRKMMNAGGRCYLGTPTHARWHVSKEMFKAEKGVRRLLLMSGKDLNPQLSSLPLQEVWSIMVPLGFHRTTPEDLLLFRTSLTEAQLAAMGINKKVRIFATHSPYKVTVEQMPGIPATEWANTVLETAEVAVGNLLTSLHSVLWEGRVYPSATTWFLFRLPI
jgi:hypothetical protein